MNFSTSLDAVVNNAHYYTMYGSNAVTESAEDSTPEDVTDDPTAVSNNTHAIVHDKKVWITGSTDP